MTEVEQRRLSAALMGVMDVINAAASIASRTSDTFQGTDAHEPCHRLCIEIGRFADQSPAMTELRRLAHARHEIGRKP